MVGAFLHHIFGGTVITKILCCRNGLDLLLERDVVGRVVDRGQMLGNTNVSLLELFLELKIVTKLKRVILILFNLIFEF